MSTAAQLDLFGDPPTAVAELVAVSADAVVEPSVDGPVEAPNVGPRARLKLQLVRLCSNAAVETSAGPCAREGCRYSVAAGPRCALVVADEHPAGMTLEEVGAVLGCTRERARQLEEKAIEKVTARLRRLDPGSFDE